MIKSIGQTESLNEMDLITSTRALHFRWSRTKRGGVAPIRTFENVLSLHKPDIPCKCSCEIADGWTCKFSLRRDGAREACGIERCLVEAWNTIYSL
jgi:hypothetical protein